MAGIVSKGKSRAGQGMNSQSFNFCITTTQLLSVNIYALKKKMEDVIEIGGIGNNMSAKQTRRIPFCTNLALSIPFLMASSSRSPALAMKALCSRGRK